MARIPVTTENKGPQAAIGLIVAAFIYFGVIRGNDTGPGIVPSFDTSKFDAEEAGYGDEFNRDYSKGSGYARDIVRAIRDAVAYQTATRDEDKKKYEAAIRTKVRKLQDLQSLAPVALRRLESTQPPPYMSGVHREFCHLLRIAQRVHDATQIEHECQQFYQAMLEFNQAIKTKPPIKNFPSPLNIVYKPFPGVVIDPFNGTAGSSFEIGVPTPIGEFSVGSQNQGVSKLILKEKGRVRYFKLDRDFDVILYSPEYVKIASNMNNKTLTIEVP